MCMAHIRAPHIPMKADTCFIFSINIIIISFGAQQGQGLLARNARRIGGHGERHIVNIDDALTGGQIAILGLIG